ncbi:HMP-PP phosphatase [uncultured Thiomicrorhabdus sp.]
MIKLVVIDLDGTLLNAEHQLGAKTIETLQATHAAGYEVMIATGRHFQDVYLLAQQLQIPVSLITSNGARVHDCRGQLLYENHIPQQLVEKVIELSSGYSVHRNIYQGDVWLVEEENKPLLDIHHASGFGYQLTDFTHIDPQHIDKFYFNATHEKLQPLEQKLQQALGDQLYITFTTEIYLEVMNKGVSKATALSQLCQDKGIEASEVIAFGDGFNDVGMLQWVGHPVIMENANPKLKQQVTNANIAKSNAEEGVADYLLNHVLKNS